MVHVGGLTPTDSLRNAAARANDLSRQNSRLLMENEALRARVIQLETQAWEQKQLERVRAKLQQDGGNGHSKSK